MHFLEVLEETRSPGYERYCWGYPFHWETRNGTLRAGTPMITSVPYVYEAFREVYVIDGNRNGWRSCAPSRSMRFRITTKRHFSLTRRSCSYKPDPRDSGGVVNASAYRAFLLTRATHRFFRTETSSRRGPESQFRSRISESGRLLVLLHRTGNEILSTTFTPALCSRRLPKIEALTGNAIAPWR